MIIGGHGAEIGVGLWAIIGVSGEIGSDLGSDPGLVELFLLIEKLLLFVFGFLLVESLPLPFVEAAGEGTRTAAHGTEEGEG